MLDLTILCGDRSQDSRFRGIAAHLHCLALFQSPFGFPTESILQSMWVWMISDLGNSQSFRRTESQRERLPRTVKMQ